jgi:hypothetical protein
VAIVIPVYKETLTYSETLSLNQCIKILSDYPIIFVMPNELNFDRYPLLLTKNYQIARFDDNYFESIDGYNKLMLSTGFYKKFLNYKFILVYQLDAFVFKDELLYWCNQNYDFIGAPQQPHTNNQGEMQFLRNYSRLLNFLKKAFRVNHHISNVGNGGFSLRKTRSFYYLLKVLRPRIKKWGKNNEDVFFRYWGNIFYPFFKLPPDDKALHFSIEVSPEENLNKLNNALPFGCHAFEKYDWDTWKPFISVNE